MPQRRLGLSLIELTIVVLIIGITAALAVPRFADSVRATKLRSAVSQLASHIDYIREVAINEGRTTTLVCDNSLHTYGSDNVHFPERPGELLKIAVQELHDAGFQLSADFDSKTELSFDFEGVPHVDSQPMSAGSVTLRGGGETFRVLIAAGTGETSVQRLVSGQVVSGTASAQSFSN